jgi:hypothetical protein
LEIRNNIALARDSAAGAGADSARVRARLDSFVVDMELYRNKLAAGRSRSDQTLRNSMVDLELFSSEVREFSK